MNRVHKFELAGLGKAPYRFIGFAVMKFQACQGAPVQPGASCRYCGTGIMNVYELESADGRRFRVGSDCIHKAGDAGLMRVVSEQEKKARREANDRRKARDKTRVEAEIGTVDRDALAKLPHPDKRWADQGQTALHWFDWFARHAGNRTMLKIIKEAHQLTAVGSCANG